VLARPRSIGKIPLSTILAADRRGVAGAMFFVTSAAAPLTAVTGRVPSGLALTGLPGLSHPHLGVADVRALVSVDRVAKARHLTNAAALYA
jgi:hypothetical protein